MRYSIVGMYHRGTEAKVAALEAGVGATLVREPDNKFDRNAVAVWIGDVHVGYVPKAQNRLLAAKIDRDGVHWPAPTTVVAEDGKVSRAVPATAIAATFVRSPNSGYPMVEVET